MDFSVLMSVYAKEDDVFLNQALESTLVNQSVIPNELILVKDGPLTAELEDVIQTYQSKFHSILKVVQLDTNKGLGEALRIGLERCSFDIVARMDSDDINHYCRFEKQLKVFEENPDVDLVGAHIAEFFSTTKDIKFIRKVPVSGDEIQRRTRRRNPINHVSVMFKKSAVISAGGYKHLPFMEDYYLWIRMMVEGFVMSNIDETLVYVRTGEEMFKRRSNPECIKSWFFLQKEMNKYGLTNKLDFIINIINMIVFVYTPPKLKKYIYKFVLREDMH